MEIINKLTKKHKMIVDMIKEKEKNEKEYPTIYSEAADIIIKKEAAIKKINKKLNTYKAICISILSLLLLSTLLLINEWRK
jgi:hypothetical protein